MLLVPPTVDIKSYSLGHFDKFRYKVETKATTLWFEFPFNIEHHSTAVTLISPKYPQSADHAPNPRQKKAQITLKAALWHLSIWGTFVLGHLSGQLSEQISEQLSSNHQNNINPDICQWAPVTLTLANFWHLSVSQKDTCPISILVLFWQLSPLNTCHLWHFFQTLQRSSPDGKHVVLSKLQHTRRKQGQQLVTSTNVTWAISFKYCNL